MSVVKSFSVGNGDMFYIRHNSDNFSIIDCCLDDNTEDDILTEIADLSKKKGVIRLISTHPDDDHIRGLESLDNRLGIRNFYCVKNNVTKEDETDSFTRYCELRDHETKAFYIKKGCSRRWMNESSDERKRSGINILWPDPNNEEFKKVLEDAEDGGSPNNISAIIKYELDGGATVLWMGDLETEFMESIEDELDLPLVDILFAPHHGRDSGRVPRSLLDKMDPRMIVIGEAPSEHLCYYDRYNTICQNSAGDIIFECLAGEVHVFTSNEYEAGFLENRNRAWQGYHYVGTLPVEARTRAATA
jgi:beta-lactamase superfamily II metal-dependent hydrolase